MTHDEKEIKRKLRILKHAEYSGNIPSVRIVVASLELL